LTDITDASPESVARLCRLQHAAGRVEACPGACCPFWEPGGAVLAGRCALDQVDLSARPELAAWLLRIRKRLEAAGTREDEPALRLFYRLSGEGKRWGVLSRPNQRARHV